MAGTSTSRLAAAVSDAGALGSIAIGAMDVASARSAIQETEAATRRPFNVNVFCHRPPHRHAAVEADWVAALTPQFEAFNATPPVALRELYRSFVGHDAMLDVLLATRPAVVSFHFGLPSGEFVGRLRAAGVLLFSTATSLAEAMAAVDANVDVIVAQGYEAGGHRGMFDPDGDDARLGTLPLVRLLTARLDCPVVAAGGIMDGAGVAAALALGAQAAQLGTAFIGCPESAADATYRSALFSEAAHHTRMTRVISGRPARCLANAFTDLGWDVSPDRVPAYPVAYDAGKQLNAAARAAGEGGYGAHWAGQGAPLARSLPAADLVRQIAGEIEIARCDRSRLP